jgi:transitional endoplasmic reticulum ATPase
MAEGQQGIRLQVANSRAEDAGRGVARVGPRELAELGLKPGDGVEIIGKRHTAAIVVPHYP